MLTHILTHILTHMLTSQLYCPVAIKSFIMCPIQKPQIFLSIFFNFVVLSQYY